MDLKIIITVILSCSPSGTRTHDHEVNILKYICCMKPYQNAIFTSVKVKVQFVNYLLFAFL